MIRASHPLLRGRALPVRRRRTARRIANAAIAVGAVLLLWVGTVWVWQDPLTALYTAYQQHRLGEALDTRFATFAPVARPLDGDRLAAEARRYRLAAHPGDAMARLTIPRLDLDAVVVDGTDDASLRKGPGFHRGAYLPGEGELVYIAGHRTTYGAVFSHIERLRRGDRVTLELPYGTFVYAVTHHRVVPATDVAVLKTHHREVLVLQACHPRFFATHRYLAYARLVRVTPAKHAPANAQAVRR